MIVEISVVGTDDFSVEHLLDSTENKRLISEFKALKICSDTNIAVAQQQKINYNGLCTIEEIFNPISHP